MNTSTGDVALTVAELRVVADFARASAEEVLHIFEAAQPDDARPRAAVEAARGPRSWRRRRGCLSAPTRPGDPGRAHPAGLGTGGTVLELSASAGPQVGEAAIERARQRATATLVEVLCRYPVAPTGRGRVAELMSALDADLRSAHG